MKPQKRACPKCGVAVQVAKSVPMVKTAAGGERISSAMIAAIAIAKDSSVGEIKTR